MGQSHQLSHLQTLWVSSHSQGHSHCDCQTLCNSKPVLSCMQVLKLYSKLFCFSLQYKGLQLSTGYAKPFCRAVSDSWILLWAMLLNMAEFGEKSSLHEQPLHSMSYLLNLIFKYSIVRVDVKYLCPSCYALQSSPKIFIHNNFFLSF